MRLVVVMCYGAVPRYLVPDNLRTAITKHTKDELIVNSAYQDLEQFYDVVILPPPARKNLRWKRASSGWRPICWRI